MTQLPRASLALEEPGLSHRVLNHRGEVTSPEQAAREGAQEATEHTAFHKTGARELPRSG